jgi:glycosyltransferase involved in cell wall biosynthesis
MCEIAVSVIIPAYNSAATIRRALDSVIEQTAPVHEIIVVDDGSQDDLESVVRLYAGRVHYVHKPNGGAASARNLGIDIATGSIIAFLDADDYWEPHKLARQCDIFRKYPEVGVVGSCVFQQVPGCERSEIRKAVPLDQVLVCTGPNVLRTGCQLWTGTVAIRRDVLGEHRFDTDLKTAEDRDMWIRLVAESPVYVLAEPLATAVLEPGSLSRTNIDRDFSSMLRVVHRYQAFLSTDDLRSSESDIYRRWAGVLMSEGNYGPAFKAAWRGLERRPLDPFAWWALTKSAVLNVTRPRHPRAPAS